MMKQFKFLLTMLIFLLYQTLNCSCGYKYEKLKKMVDEYELQPDRSYTVQELINSGFIEGKRDENWKHAKENYLTGEFQIPENIDETFVGYNSRLNRGGVDYARYLRKFKPGTDKYENQMKGLHDWVYMENKKPPTMTETQWDQYVKGEKSNHGCTIM